GGAGRAGVPWAAPAGQEREARPRQRAPRVETPPTYGGPPCPLHSSRLFAPRLSLLMAWPSGLAHRRCALEAVKKVVTARKGKGKGKGQEKEKGKGKGHFRPRTLEGTISTAALSGSGQRKRRDSQLTLCSWKLVATQTRGA